MEPLNQKERKKAFLNFLLFFIITCALIIATVLFSIEVPFKQNEQLREQVKLDDKDKDFSEAFITKMNSTDHLLDSLDKKGVNADLIDNKIEAQLTDMDAMIEKDSIPSNSLYQSAVANLSDLHAAKKELRDAVGKDASLGDLKQQVADLKASLDKSQTNEDVLRAQLVSMQGPKQNQ